ncbi:MAG: hypothetical protein ACREOE_03340, partial [Gemmatimonadales bacterium]
MPEQTSVHDEPVQAMSLLHEPIPVQQAAVMPAWLVILLEQEPVPLHVTEQLPDPVQEMSLPHALAPMQATVQLAAPHAMVPPHELAPLQSTAHDVAPEQSTPALHAFSPQLTW